MKVQVEIEIPDNVAAEWEVIAYRPAEAGEYFLNSAQEAEQMSYGTVAPWPILRKKWQWPPSFEGVAAMARTSDGKIFAMAAVPTAGLCGWEGGKDYILLKEWAFPNLNFPRPDRWQDSLRINPNFKQ